MYVFVYHEYSFLFIASFAFVLQRLRAKPIPLKMHERVQRLPPGGSSRRSRVRESALRYNQSKSKVARAPSVTLRVPPSSRRKAMFLPTVHPKGVTHYTLQSKACEKEYEQIVRTPFVVGRGVISRRFLCIYRLFSAAASHRPTRLR